MNDEPITAYRRVRTMEGWAPEDDLSTEVTPNAPSAEAPYRSVWVAYNHDRREYVSGAPWPREASVDGKRTPFSRDLEELRAEVVQLYQEVEFWTKSASTWRERALEYWDADGEKQEEELVERVAKWAYSRSMDFLEDGPEWEALGSFVDMPTPRAEWLSQARAAIEGER